MRLRRNTLNNNVVNKNDLTFPPFIPDDPEMPHLSCRKKERKRQALIREIVKEILNYKAGEWSHESMQNQDNMFDKASTDSQIYWGKLAMNVLFSCNSKSVVKKYKEERDEYVDPDWERTDSTRMTAIEKSLNIKKRVSVRAKSIGTKQMSELPPTPKGGTAKVDVASNEGGSVSSNPMQEKEDGNSPIGKSGALGKMLLIPPQGPTQMSRRGSIASNMAVLS